MNRSAMLIPFTLLLGACTMTPQMPVAPQGMVVYGLTTDGRLATFGSDNASASVTTRAISGLPGGASLVDLDVRPMDGKLYGITSAGSLYRIDATSGAATLVSAPADGVTLMPTSMDFNPAVDRTRVFAMNDQNFRVNQTTTTFTPTADGLLKYAEMPDANPDLAGAAYDNSYQNGGTPPVAIEGGEPATRLFSVDRSNNQLVRHESAPGSTPAGNFSTLRPVGPLGITLGSNVGFDITTTGGQLGTDTALLVNGDSLYTVNLTSGMTTFKSKTGVVLKAIAIQLSTP
ncbi:DUF4394 domain-containing protein [Deinococcus cellulosilyticus]|uniref:DUF4394 domain-containing protein n=1 Tax=Deinococcus cellulosilyticus (strain DSM 18568 / NBRC 106333 / KACC 11606 / 5516J-15) TaxID=1223518 RepID=A0A511MXR5_DEIC1|nr:DUF4394 domain-containing protein [Deinococcus cellulosilyticus]GEM44947.1 hypothetical protein DC3_05820 [Deinococcus cellulosilyticus NBRC 106333 = KACC 11606]